MGLEMEKIAQQEIQLTDYEFKRLQELTEATGKGEEGLIQFTAMLRQLAESLRETKGRRAELVALLANKYEFDPATPFTLNEDNKIILGGASPEE